jgi:hypothetical protein
VRVSATSITRKVYRRGEIPLLVLCGCNSVKVRMGLRIAFRSGAHPLLQYAYLQPAARFYLVDPREVH